MEIGTSGLSAIRGDGESQLYIFPVGGRNVSAGRFYSFDQAAQVV